MAKRTDLRVTDWVSNSSPIVYQLDLDQVNLSKSQCSHLNGAANGLVLRIPHQNETVSFVSSVLNTVPSTE